MEVIKLKCDKLPASTGKASGKPVIFLHGLLGNISNWRPIARDPTIGGNRDCYLVDLRNHGRSPHSLSMNLREMTRDIFQLIEDHGIEDPILLGHSLGGKVAMAAALEEPSKVGGLIVVDIAPVNYKSNNEVAYHSQLARVLEAICRVPLIDVSSRKELLAQKPDLDPKLAQFIMTNYMPDRTNPENETYSGRVWKWRCNMKVLRDSYDTDIIAFPEFSSTYGKQALFIRGGSSKHHIIGPDSWHQPIIDGFFPQSETITIDGAGHWVHVEKPIETRNTLAECLERLD